jgi:zinc transport system substrate-binding protein
MKSMRAALAVAVLLLGACGESASSPEVSVDPVGSLVVYTVNYPLAWLAERIGAERVAVVFPAPAGVDPAFWSPDGETVAAYQRADLVLKNGAGYARWVSRASLPRSRSLDTAAGFEDRWLPIDDATTHGHGPEGNHTHRGWAATIWLDPTLAIEQGRAIAAALRTAIPDSEAANREHFDQVVEELTKLDERLEAATKRLRGAPLLFSHPVYQYLIARYGLNARSLHWEPGEYPGEPEWTALEALLVEHPARVLFWEGPPIAKTVARLETLGIQSSVYDPCANAPAEGDFLSVAQANAQALEDAAALLARGPSPPRDR